MFSLASKLYETVIGSSGEQLSTENETKDPQSVQVSLVKETTIETTDFAVPAIPVPKMKITEDTGTRLFLYAACDLLTYFQPCMLDTLDIPPAFPSIDSPQRTKPSQSKLTPLEKANKLRKKVNLEPGHSALDWARLKNSLGGVSEIRRYTLDELKLHKTKNDAWTAINGKIYNITPYLKFHPGGEKELMRAAGKDGTKLFMDIHSWVNYDLMLDKCFVGFLVGIKTTLT
ncbi:26513_t:CDS:2 [Dentiscutata erythropus]|uniref:26513_t:CDS:1 n=1 Tax=Dentiscutata erythropus TaxID=1348616 RepID=A0A9N9FBD9_9GLOM|nr:26513_t:CDS:2 [Dentiscutata erythropus]